MRRGPKPSKVAACGHLNHVADGRCWNCHLAHLRATGDGERADRLETAKRQHDEGRFDLATLEAGMVDRLMEEYADRPEETDVVLPRPARRLRHGRPDGTQT